MSATRDVTLTCDQRGCDDTFTSQNDSVWHARESARLDWEWRVAVAGLDFCAKHNTATLRRAAA